MAGRTTGNKRQREMLLKERQAQKLTRRDERRKRVGGDGVAVVEAVGDEPANESAPASEGGDRAPHAAPEPLESTK